MDHLRFLLPYQRKAERAIPRAVQGTIYLTGRGSIPLRYRHLDGFRATAAQDIHRDGFADYIAIERGKEIVGIADRLAAYCNQDIADEQAAFFCRPGFFQPQDQQALTLFALEGFARGLCDLTRLCAHTEIAALDRAMLCKRVCDSPGNFNRNGEGVAARETGCIESKHFTFGVDQWPA